MCVCVSHYQFMFVAFGESFSFPKVGSHLGLYFISIPNNMMVAIHSLFCPIGKKKKNSDNFPFLRFQVVDQDDIKALKARKLIVPQ